MAQPEIQIPEGTPVEETPAGDVEMEEEVEESILPDLEPELPVRTTFLDEPLHML